MMIRLFVLNSSLISEFRKYQNKWEVTLEFIVQGRHFYINQSFVLLCKRLNYSFTTNTIENNFELFQKMTFNFCFNQ